jgi:phospholipase/carboxylesterase
MLLHGLGANGQDLLGLAPIYAQMLPDAVFVSPDAPFECDMVPPGYGNSFQWFSLQSRDPHLMLSGVQKAAPILDSFITEQLEEQGVPANKLALLGFSQGTMMSLYVGPRYPEPLAGVLGYSGALLWEQDIPVDSLHKIPVHLVHGEADDVVPVGAYHAAKMRLESSGFDVSGHTTKHLFHNIDEEGIASGARFLQKILA